MQKKAIVNERMKIMVRLSMMSLDILSQANLAWLSISDRDKKTNCPLHSADKTSDFMTDQHAQIESCFIRMFLIVQAVPVAFAAVEPVAPSASTTVLRGNQRGMQQLNMR